MPARGSQRAERRDDPRRRRGSAAESASCRHPHRGHRRPGGDHRGRDDESPWGAPGRERRLPGRRPVRVRPRAGHRLRRCDHRRHGAVDGVGRRVADRRALGASLLATLAWATPLHDDVARAGPRVARSAHEFPLVIAVVAAVGWVHGALWRLPGASRWRAARQRRRRLAARPSLSPVDTCRAASITALAAALVDPATPSGTPDVSRPRNDAIPVDPVPTSPPATRGCCAGSRGRRRRPRALAWRPAPSRPGGGPDGRRAVRPAGRRRGRSDSWTNRDDAPPACWPANPDGCARSTPSCRAGAGAPGW